MGNRDIFQPLAPFQSAVQFTYRIYLHFIHKTQTYAMIWQLKTGLLDSQEKDHCAHNDCTGYTLFAIIALEKMTLAGQILYYIPVYLTTLAVLTWR
jgi:hypothetical protein